MTPSLLDNPLAAGPAFPLSLWQKRQATLLYYWMSLDYLKGLKKMLDKLSEGGDVQSDFARSLGCDALMATAHFYTNPASPDWSSPGHPALLDFRRSTKALIALRAKGIYGNTGANQCAHMIGEFGARYETLGEAAAFRYAHMIDATAGSGGQRNFNDSSMVSWWEDYAGRFPRLPKFRVRTDVVGKTGKCPPRTGVYVPQDDPYGTLQFAWTRNSDGILGEVQTFNDAGLAAVKAIGRGALWLDERKMMAYVIEALRQGRLQPTDSIDLAERVERRLAEQKRRQPTYATAWKAVDSLNSARLVLSDQVYIERPCKWYFVEMIEGEFDDAAEDEANAVEPTRRPNVPAGQRCPEAGWWFTPVQSESRRYFKQGDTLPSLGGDYGETFWQWSPDQSAPKL